ncbi:ORF6N domain-containing protein [Psychrobacillus sp.]|uniref:ORF6N domain-containing protein n=1 Tax=Psychrobacillus sp. TaxID=1871623 RepID=UPI0028BEF97D|nr:ORF6N domain-containing protein [Psychrobacillus sp.]
MDLKVIEQDGMRVLTSAQLAEAFETKDNIIQRNFQRNQERYEEGKHYFSLTGENLKAFKGSQQNDVSLKYVSVLYLWTEQGALLHAKSLSNEQAWKAYTMLTEGYYNLNKKMQSPEFLIAQQDLKICELEDKLEKTEKKVLAIEQSVQNQITLNSGEQKRLQKAVGERVFALEKNPSRRAEVFRAIYSSIKQQYAVKSYRDVKQNQLQKAIKYVGRWNG